MSNGQDVMGGGGGKGADGGGGDGLYTHPCQAEA